MKRIVAAIIICAFAWPAIASADEAQSRALAEELLNAMDMQKNIEKSFEIVKEMIPAQMKEMSVSGDASSDKAQEAMREGMDFYRKEMTWDKLKDDYIAIYAETFTEEELRGLVAFYKSPVGMKFVEKQPELMKRAMEVSQRQMMEIMPKMQKRIQEIKERESVPPVD